MSFRRTHDWLLFDGRFNVGLQDRFSSHAIDGGSSRNRRHPPFSQTTVSAGSVERYQRSRVKTLWTSSLVFRFKHLPRRQAGCDGVATSAGSSPIRHLVRRAQTNGFRTLVNKTVPACRQFPL